MIKFENVSVYYNKKEVLKNINFEINKIENIALIGCNGCGKTTLLKAFANIIGYNGKIFLKNKDIKLYKRKKLAKEITMLSQINYMHFNYTVFEIVMMGRYIYSNSPFNNSEEDIKKVNNALKIAQIYNIKDRNITSLSGGQLQRVFLAKVIAQDTNIILLDEPTNHLDLNYKIEFINFLKTWAKQENKLIISVFHDINLSINFAKKLMLLHDGEIKAFDTTENILNSKKLDTIYKMDIKKYMINTLRKWN